MSKNNIVEKALRRGLRDGAASATRLSRDTSGNIAMLTALMLVPLLGMVGLGVDFWTKTNAQAELDAATDAATLAAINRTATLIKSNVNAKQAAAEGRAAGLHQFSANVGKVPMATTSGLELEVTVVGLTITAKASWAARSKTTFGAVVGVKSLALAGGNVAEVTLPSYVKILLLLDNSASMGIGSTKEQQKKLHDMTGNCALACHQADAFTPAQGYKPGETSYSRALAAGIETRIDVLKSAIKSITYEAEEVRASPDQFKIGLYTFNSSPKEVLAIDDRNSSDMDAVRAAADSITLATEGGGTHFESASKYLIDKVLNKTQKGDGTSASRPKVFVMLITDGVESYLDFTARRWTPLPFTRYAPTSPEYLPDGTVNGWRAWNLQAMNPKFCDAIRSDSSVTMLPLQVTYVVPITEYQDKDVRFPWIDSNLVRSGNVDNSFRQCASVDASGKKLAFKGTSPGEITKAVMEMFALATPKSARLLN